MINCPRTLCSLLLILFAIGGAPAPAQQSSLSPEGAPSRATLPTPSDLLNFQDIGKPHLSPDGRFVLVQTRRAKVEKNRYRRAAWLIPTGSTGGQERLDLRQGAHDFEWLSGSNRFGFLAPSQRGAQVWVQRVGADSARRLTNRKGGVEAYSFSPDGRWLAYTTEVQTESDSTRSDSLWGVPVDMRSFRVRQLRGDRIARHSSTDQVQLWVKDLKAGARTLVSDSLTVDDFRWSPSGTRLAITGVPFQRARAQDDGVPLYRSDLYVYNLQSERLRSLYEGRQDTSHVWEGTISYSSPFWSPSGARLGFLRTDESDRFASVAEVGIHDLQAGTTRFVTSAGGQELSAPDFHWTAPDTLLVEYTSRARRGLFRLSLDDGSTAPMWNPKADASGFSFGAEGRRVAWIQQAVGHPPEIYTARRPLNSARQISTLNNHLRNLWLPEVKSVQWTGSDGTEVQGWLVQPGSQIHSNPPPLLVLVHGGPGYVVTNQFDPYRRGGWFYPVQVFAARGYAVFIPNYRQTDSFGKDFQTVDSLDGMPVNDVVTGIEHLVAEGKADPNRIGIMGHSWGGWLGPLVVAERPIFRAASFAEGVMGDLLASYGQGYGFASRGLLEYYVGTTPYETPKRYLELSPAFREQFTETTPTLLEYGQESGTGVEGSEVGRALWRHGTPHKVVFYRNAGHGLRRPAALVESMKRNLKWFDRWMSPGSAHSSEPSSP